MLIEHQISVVFSLDRDSCLSLSSLLAQEPLTAALVCLLGKLLVLIPGQQTLKKFEHLEAPYANQEPE